MGKHRDNDRERSEERHKHKKHKKEKKHKRDREGKPDRYNDRPALPQNIPYSDINNPFNDSNLTETFVWGKKLKLEGKDTMSKRKIDRMNREKVYKNVEEMDKLKRERDARQAAREDIEMIARDEEKRQNQGWKQIEQDFHLNQAKLRSKIRIKESRPMPIDLLMRYVFYGEPSDGNSRDEYEDFELEQPTKYIKNLDADQFEDLLKDIEVTRLIDNGKHPDFWDDITTIAKFELKKLKNERAEENIHSNVVEGVLASFEKKSFDELKQMEREMIDRIKGHSRGLDVSFWEDALELLRPKMARTRLKELHTKKMKMRLEQIRAEQKKATERHEKDHNVILPSTSSASKPVITKEEKNFDSEIRQRSDSTLQKEDLETIEAYDSSRPLPFTINDLENLDDEQKEQKWSQLNDAQLSRFVVEVYKSGGYSPKYLKEEVEAMPGIEVLDENEDGKNLKQQRSGIKDPSGGSLSATEAKLMEIAKMGMGGDESSFAVEESLGHQDLLWADKFRPQKPKYFNRVHTGFDWNKYNQTHYDMDNPPPKIVQGYRFNIFYPDLLDVTKTPYFTLTECPGDPDFAILRFHAGPPYEDIAFKIVHREWEANHKQGYKSQFASGVFQLWFFFKRYRYRR